MAQNGTLELIAVDAVPFATTFHAKSIGGKATINHFDLSSPMNATTLKVPGPAVILRHQRFGLLTDPIYAFSSPPLPLVPAVVEA
jgi:hypothetical protein